MKVKILKHAAILLLLAGCLSSCGKDKSQIDFSNIENLYAQPLPVIQECVQGKWKWVSISRWGYLGYILLTNTFVEITENSVVITQEDYNGVDVGGTFSYEWKKKENFVRLYDLFDMG